MLGKILKYDIKENGRVLLPLYGAMIALSAVLGLALNLSLSGEGLLDLEYRSPVVPKAVVIFFSILGVALFITVIASFVVTLIMIIRNFRRNLLGSRGYLMWTLPVKTSDQVISKTINGTLWFLVNGAALLLSVLLGLLIMNLSNPDLMNYLREVQDFFLSDQFWARLPLLLLQAGILILAGSAATVSEIYLALAIGHLWSAHPLAGALGALIGINMVLSALENLLSRGFINLLLSGDALVSDSGFFSLAMWLQVAWYIAMAVIFTILTSILLKRKLNLE